jgi:type II secretory ATPase GspE/PulE/Tfp pilus assembly ATPase PilB-like protein
MALRRCIKDVSNKKTLTLETMPEVFTFDYIACEETTQSEIFQEIGRSIIDQCLHGYNGSILAYGQTGSGKTFTI